MPLKVNEIYFSIQGESTYAGSPCIFIRLTYCNLRCTYCDTTYAFYEGKYMEISEIIEEINEDGEFNFEQKKLILENDKIYIEIDSKGANITLLHLKEFIDYNNDSLMLVDSNSL